MTRLERKNREDILFKGCGGITDAIDDFLKQLYRINDDEYDYIAEFAKDDELDKILKSLDTFSDKKEAIKITNRLILYYHKSKENETEILRDNE